MASKITHKIQGEHVIDDMVLPWHVSQESIDEARQIEFRSGDILIVAYPKSGSTWMQHLVWLLANNNDTAGSACNIFLRSPYLECITVDGTHCTDLVKDAQSPRVVKSHLPLKYFKSQLTRDPPLKCILCIRNVKDVLVSLYHFYKMNEALGKFKGSFKEFFQMFKEKKLIYGDYFDHIIGWWEMKDDPNVLFVHYEDMKRNLEKEVRRIAEFIGSNFDDDVIQDIVEQCTFQSMKANPSTNCEHIPTFDNEISTFLRKGEVGDWKNFFSDEENEYIDRIIHERLDPVGLTLTYELSG